MTAPTEPDAPLLRTGRFLRRGEASADLHSVTIGGGREADAFYRDRWSHDKVVHSTHGVNCTGSCRWKVYVKDGIITWETQATDYPTAGPDRPEYEPRGCPRGAAFSWYTYSPTRVRYPYVRGVLLDLYREAKQRLKDPVLAWADVQGDPERRRAYQRARGKGGLVRADWDEAIEIIAAAHVHTIRTHGPDRVAGFSPIPAMSMVSHAAGARFMSLIGAPMLSFYDWYADLPVASPQVFGDQTDVPESGDWWDAAYLVMWGSNVPVTRTPDAHWMAEARYRGQKVVVVAPDYADNAKFADEWLHPHPGTDGALAMAMGHVILRECFVDRTVDFFDDYVRRFTDLPFLVTLTERQGAYVPGKFLRAADLGDTGEGAEWKTVVLDRATGGPAVPRGSLGFRWTESGKGEWNLDLGDIEPRLTLYGEDADGVEVLLPRFDTEGGAHGQGRGDVLRRGVPATRLGGPGGPLVTTVFDLLLAQYGVGREGLAGDWPASYDDASAPGTPAWQEAHTSVPAAQCTRIAREFARTAEKSRGRCMILMGAGTNHWFHSETIYRAFLALLTLTGCQGRNGGGWAHYVGQEKCRPATGWATLAGAGDWSRPPRQMIGAAYWFLHTDQWRYDRFTADVLASPLGEGRFAGMAAADCLAQATRAGWMPSYPTFDRNPLDLGEGDDPVGAAVERLRSGELKFACEDPDAPENWPRVLTLWRANLLGSSAKGAEYFTKHLLGTHSSLSAEEAGPDVRPRDVTWRERAPEGKLDLLVSLDFRMTSSTLLSDVTLPAATWYEKHDLSTTDMHPFVHAFSPAVDPPWQARTDFDTFRALADRLSELAAGHLDTRRDLVATALQHDTPGEIAQPGGVALDWRRGECAPVPGKTLPNLTVVERDYTAIGAKFAALGPLVERLGLPAKGIVLRPDDEVEALRALNGAVREGAAAGRPRLDTAVKAANTILALSGTTNGRLATQGFRTLQERTGQEMAQLAAEHEGKRISYADTQAAPVPVITSPEWSGSESGGRRYTAFTLNTEHLKPWHTLTGRQHFFLDHDWIHELGEALPVYRPPLDMHRLFGEPALGPDGTREVTVRYLTPHNKWSIHSEYQDNLFMLSLSRGGQVIWMSPADAAAIGVADNDWIEAVNRNGVVAARAVVSHRMPEGTVYMHHAQERTVGVPRTETTGRRGGIHNSLTRLLLKPTHLIGGYAQLTWAFNYLGPTGNQRDEVTVIRRRTDQEVTYQP
ncbi:nitrate reductase subunit alpha [Streptomyces spectabilis]|uniref:Nitrate reductase alpha subunit n=1 Tax=Streptomyces spectabilis TaxID=68270 RepID=A0A5P2XBF6_STRST|nr:nitrate reductase subunit alpha [Streptomyces spectabilis]MBB5107648.1 nitrate reductase alpha subunit [Streptomyces spectabilis]MCI3904686.1 nitrate reductase subunit alpha [Streptomyces spectabilis]QEV61758.1 nitrate reductase subunit alpha [Streptomyces spectabilis]GGV03218.1 nitrate reductase subunit alpha [Streptomyces spectabilis]